MKINKNEFVLNISGIIIFLLFIFPLYWLILSSLKIEIEIFKSPPDLFPKRIFLDAYIDQFSGKYNMFKSFFNSIIISSFSMIFSIILSIPAAYGLARFKIKGKRVFILLFLVTQMLPATLILTPLFIIFRGLGFLNTYCAPIIADATISIPFAVLMLRTYFISIPKELDDSAKIDGCNSLTSFYRIILPIAFPGVIVAMVFSFIFAWGDLIYALTFINKQEMRPLTAGIYNFVGQYGIQWNRIMAFGFVTIFPLIIIFIFMQKSLVKGLVSGSVKG